jgi:hypothetical protein
MLETEWKYNKQKAKVWSFFKNTLILLQVWRCWERDIDLVETDQLPEKDRV